MQAVTDVSGHREHRSTAPGLRGAIRVLRFASVLVIGVAVLLIPHVAWRLLRPGRPSPIARACLRLLCAAAGFAVHRHGPAIGRHALIVANHVSWADILTLGSAAPMTFVAKSEVRGWPGLGLLARLAPTLFVRREARGEAQAQSARVAAALQQGAVALFPEGTTGNGSHVLPFRSALFAGAAQVQPVAIAYGPPPGRHWTTDQRAAFAWDGDKPFLPHVIAVIAAGGARCTLTALPPVCNIDRKACAAAARDAIVAALAR